MKDKRAWCPRCLYEATDREFSIQRVEIVPEFGTVVDTTDHYTRKEKVKEQRVLKGMRRCPDCGQRFRLSSMLTPDMTTESYAAFVAAYPGFFHGIDFSKWSGRLKAYGMSQDFWTVYKTEKARIHGYDTYDEYKAAAHRA